MSKIRVLIVDDSVVIRRLVGDALAQDPAMEVAGIAANGNIALQKILQCNPDLVTLDIEMPDMDGLATLREIRQRYPRLPVIMFSTLTQRGAHATLEALSLGATDYVTKPSNVGSVQTGIQRIHDELIPKIKSICQRQPSTIFPVPPAARVAAPARLLPGAAPLASPGGAHIVVIGTSTGGPNALAEVIPELPANFPVPIMVVQHMPPLFTRLLAERLNSRSKLTVCEATAGTELKPGVVYIAPGDYHMFIECRGFYHALGLNQDPPENSCRPAVDVLFRSAAQHFGRRTLAAVLTGMGQDGLRGCEAIREAGGQILAQDETSSVVWGMPGFVARTGLADRVLPLGYVAKEITSRVAAAVSPAAVG